MQQYLDFPVAKVFYNQQLLTIERLLLISYFIIPFSSIFPLLFIGLFQAFFEGKILLFAIMFFITAFVYFLSSKLVDYANSTKSKYLKIIGLSILIYAYLNDNLVSLSVYIFVIGILLADKLEFILQRIQLADQLQIFNTEREHNSYEYELQGLYLQERLKWALSTTALTTITMIPLYIATLVLSTSPTFKILYYVTFIIIAIYFAPRIFNYRLDKKDPIE